MYNFTTANRNQWMNEGAELLNHYGHETADKGMSKIWEVFTQNKGNVAEILSQHPNWDPDILAVRLTEEYSTSVDKNKIKAFARFLRTRLDKWCEAREVKFACMTRKEVRAGMRRIADCITAIESVPREYHPVIINGMTQKELKAEYYRLDKIDDKFIDFSLGFEDHRLTNENYCQAEAIRNTIGNIETYCENILSDNMAKVLNRNAAVFFPMDAEGKPIRKVRFAKGQKTSKAVSKFFSLVGDEFVKFKDVQTKTWVDQSGRLHSRDNDHGWNGQFAAYGDGINPVKVKRYTFISINPLDYLTMSFFENVASCHTIDYQNLRPNNNRGGHAYGGMYQSGTMSYMLDEASIIMYTTKDDVDIKHPWNYNKQNRCVFNLGEEKFVQGRLYPDGRDNPCDPETTTIASCFRSIFQRVVSECMGYVNLWTITRENYDYTESYGTHYRDYEEYSDTLTCLLKGSHNTSPVEIGHMPICPVCGEEHGNEGSLHCGDRHKCFRDGYHEKCARCGCWVDTRDSSSIHDLDTDRWYDDNWCATASDVFYCENVDEWHSEDVYRDSNGNYFYDPDDERIEIGSYCFVDEESANECGFFKDENGNWVR